MNLTRRGFLKLSGAVTGFLITSSAFDLVKIPKALADMGPKVGTETTSICCCCACGCGMLITTEDFGGPNQKVINVEGDPTHPTNEGGLCSKCLSAKDTVNALISDADLASYYPAGTFIGPGQGITEWPYDKRAERVLWRKPGTDRWKVITWTAALERIAKLTKYHRGWNFQNEADDGAGEMTVNRTTRLACLGGAAHDNQECYLLRKLMTGLGLVYIEHQARI